MRFRTAAAAPGKSRFCLAKASSIFCWLAKITPAKAKAFFRALRFTALQKSKPDFRHWDLIKNYERRCISRRIRFKTLSADQNYEQTFTAGLRQTDDLLPDPDIDQRRHRRHYDRHRRQLRGAFPAIARERQGFRLKTSELHIPAGRRRHRRRAFTGRAFCRRQTGLRRA